MKKNWQVSLLVAGVLALGVPAWGHDHGHVHEHEAEEEVEDRDRSVAHRVLFYLPNRVFDLLDVVRARVRLGPGIAVGARATELVDVYLGSYTSVYVGLPGPRGRRLPRLPIGVEGNHGVEVSVADGTTGFGFAPNYGPAEIGAGAQLALIGVDVGIEPLELVDFFVGLVGFDLRDDDL